MSEWLPVTNGAPQGSPDVHFMTYINDNESEDKVRATVLQKKKKKKDCEVIQKELDKIVEWSEKRQMTFNFDKSRNLGL